MGNCLNQSSDVDDSTLLNESDHHQPVEQSPERAHDQIQNPVEVEHQYAQRDGPGSTAAAVEFTEEQQSKRAQRIGLIHHLPTDKYIENTNAEVEKQRECVICMIDFQKDDIIRTLPCLHKYHQSCIDDWLLRNGTMFACPTCMEPIQAALLTSYNTELQTPASLPVTVISIPKPEDSSCTSGGNSLPLFESK